jgi:thiol-disulfide isomerase/thioredoxin
MIKRLVLAVLLVGVAGAVIAFYTTSIAVPTWHQQPAAGEADSPPLAGSVAEFTPADPPLPAPATVFRDGEGREVRLSDFEGRLVLLNVWATWCAPCRHEMPSLDRLQGMLGGEDFEVVALSIDRAGIEVIRKFYAEVSIRNLAIYNDQSGKAARELGTVGVPASLLIDREGREVGRLIGPAEWDRPEIVAFLKRVVEEPTKR